MGEQVLRRSFASRISICLEYGPKKYGKPLSVSKIGGLNTLALHKSQRIPAIQNRLPEFVDQFDAKLIVDHNKACRQEVEYGKQEICRVFGCTTADSRARICRGET